MLLKKYINEQIKKEYYVAEHESGLKIYLYQMKGFTSYYGLFGTRYGSIDNEFTDENGKKVILPEGIAHFLEHKLFESEDGDAFTKYAKTGAYSNAYTSFDRTCYLFSCSNLFYENLGILLNFVQSPYFTAKTVQKEQGIIGQEIRMYDDQPSWRVLFNMLGAMFHNHPVKVDIAGTEESISHITDKLLYTCYDRFYDPSNMFVILAGDFENEKVLDFIERNLTKSGKSINVLSDFPNEPSNVVSNNVSCRLDVSKPMFCLGFKEKMQTENPTVFQTVSMEILMKMLVGSASELYKRLLDNELINEEFASEYFTGRSFSVPMFDGESKDPRQVLALLLETVEKMKSEGIDKVLFEAVKREMYGKMLRRFDGAESVCSMLCDSAVLGYDIFEHFKVLESITPEQVEKRLDVFSEQNAVLSVIDPLDNAVGLH